MRHFLSFLLPLSIVSYLVFSKPKPNTIIHCAPKQVTDSPEVVIRYVTVNEYNVFSHIELAEECREISTDSLHPDPAQLYRHGDTLEIGLRFYKK